MVEVGGRLARVVRTVVEAMTALPDILAGLFIYTFLIIALGFQRSGFAAGVALSVMMLPIIARSADVAAASRAGRPAGSQPRAGRDPVVGPCGGSCIPTQRSGLATAVILGHGPGRRRDGTGADHLRRLHVLNFNPFNNPMNSLPLFIFTAVRSGEPNFIERGFAAGVVLLAMRADPVRCRPAPRPQQGGPPMSARAHRSRRPLPSRQPHAYQGSAMRRLFALAAAIPLAAIPLIAAGTAQADPSAAAAGPATAQINGSGSSWVGERRQPGSPTSRAARACRSSSRTRARPRGGPTSATTPTTSPSATSASRAPTR